MVKLFISFIILFVCFESHSQTDYEVAINQWQNELNEEFADPQESPLEKKDRKKFISLDFFPITPKWRIEAEFEYTPFSKPFTMPTTTERKPVYVQYGIAHFEVDGVTFHFPIYQNLQLKEQEEYKDYLFAPFTDLTTGFSSYGGGRYVDLRIPENNGKKIIIDFNKSYNPYCAYNGKYSCPIPPAENDLALKIEAGVKAWKNDTKH